MSVNHNHDNGGLLQSGMIIWFWDMDSKITNLAARTTELVDCLGKNFKGVYVCNGQTTTDRSPNRLLPNIIDARFIRGNTGQGVPNTGGSNTHTLTVNEMPTHSHVVDGNLTGYSGSARRDLVGAGGGASNVDSETSGNGQAHNNAPLYIELIPLVRLIP